MVGSVHQLSVPSQLQPGQTGNYKFGWPVSGYQPGGTCRVEAPITITNHSSYLGVGSFDQRAFAMIIPRPHGSNFGNLIVRPLQCRLRLRCRVTDDILGCLHQSRLCFELGTRDGFRG
jgi:hypothetical protein